MYARAVYVPCGDGLSSMPYWTNEAAIPIIDDALINIDKNKKMMKKRYRILTYDELKGEPFVYSDTDGKLYNALPNKLGAFTKQMEYIQPFEFEFDFRNNPTRIVDSFNVSEWMCAVIEEPTNWGKEFEKFLEERGVYWEFCYNRYFCDKTTFEEFIRPYKNSPPDIECAFVFRDTKHGHEYWKNISNEWERKVKEIEKQKDER
jgi:hypothetical protein